MTAGRLRHPSIFQIGEVLEVGGVIHLQGWGLGQCRPACSCHIHPANGYLYLFEDQANGRLGLKKFTVGQCSCCQPWTADELKEILEFLEGLKAMDGETA